MKRREGRNGLVFWRRLREQERKLSLISKPRVELDILYSHEVNPIIDGGCQRSVGGIKSAASLYFVLGSPFKLPEIDCKYFVHRYGPECSEAKVVLAICNLEIRNMRGKNVSIQFHITHGNG